MFLMFKKFNRFNDDSPKSTYTSNLREWATWGFFIHAVTLKGKVPKFHKNSILRNYDVSFDEPDFISGSLRKRSEPQHVRDAARAPEEEPASLTIWTLAALGKVGRLTSYCSHSTTCVSSVNSVIHIQYKVRQFINNH